MGEFLAKAFVIFIGILILVNCSDIKIVHKVDHEIILRPGNYDTKFHVQHSGGIGDHSGY